MACICAHPEAPGETGAFKLKKTNRVCARPKESDDALTMWSLACKLPPKAWITEATHITWQTKWSPKGMQLVRPYITAKADISIPSKKGFVCKPA